MKFQSELAAVEGQSPATQQGFAQASQKEFINKKKTHHVSGKCETDVVEMIIIKMTLNMGRLYSIRFESIISIYDNIGHLRWVRTDPANPIHWEIERMFGLFKPIISIGKVCQVTCFVYGIPIWVTKIGCIFGSFMAKFHSFSHLYYLQ